MAVRDVLVETVVALSVVLVESMAVRDVLVESVATVPTAAVWWRLCSCSWRPWSRSWPPAVLADRSLRDVLVEIVAIHSYPVVAIHAYLVVAIRAYLVVANMMNYFYGVGDRVVCDVLVKCRLSFRPLSC
ncbi:hypothetical protein F444_08767 [Phytophthora nicotianae P1976]|uniref:Uncharacterized protein n=1 Tax=Phytophthora nicotianae P1976 TaxID=1317066 RepID=A0A081A9X7_PHYNI|nr:hypothetical protein F444_08767 [Phytophthora nicotianae P1976]